MKRNGNWSIRHLALFTVILALFVGSTPALAGEYPALTGVKGLDAVFDYSQGSPMLSTIIFPAIKSVYDDPSVRALPAPPRTVIVFHGQAVKLLSTARKGFDKADQSTLDKVAEMIKQFKKDGVKMEVCMYAVKVMGIDPATIMPEIDKVGNGFISVLGYQAQGYNVVTLP